MLNNVLKKVQNTLNEGIKNVKMIVNTLNENRPILTIQDKKYYQDELIAEGGYALIYKIQSISDEKMYALKKITIQSPNHKKQIKREIKIWKELSKFSNIVELVDFIFTERHAYIVMEYCEEGTLLDFVNNHEGNISEVEALLIFNQVLLGVNAMHSQKPPIAHRDLKIENILKKKRNYKLCDFGSATTETFDPTTSDEFVKEQNFSNFEKHSTLYYRAPEMCDRYGEHVVSEKVDIWALGCVLYTMVFKEQPFINAQKLEIINGNYNFPQEEQKLYSEKFLDLIRVMLTPNPDNRPDVLKIMEWTNYWNDIDKIPLSPEVEEIKKKQISSGGLKNKAHKKKLLTAEEIEKIQNKLKTKEKKTKNYDEINEIFGFAKSNNDEEDQKDDNNNTKNNNNQINDMLFDVFGGQTQNEKKKGEKKGQEDLLEFYEVDESKQGNNTANKNTNLNNDLDSIFGAATNTTNTAPKNNDNKNTSSNGNNNFDLLFSSQNENAKQTNTENKQKTDLGDLLNNLNNKENNGISYEMNGNDFFSNFPSSQPAKKEEPKNNEDDLFAAFNQPKENKKEESNKTKVEDDLFSAFSQPQSQAKPKEEKKEEPKKQNLEDDLFSAFSQPQSKPKEENKKGENKPKVEDDLFAAFSQPQTQPKPKEEKKEEGNKPKVEDDLFAAFSQPQSQPKAKEEKKEGGNKPKVEDDLFAAFSQPQSKPKEEPKKADNNTNNMFDDLFSGSNQTKQEKPAEGKKEIKNDLQFDLFNFGDSSNKNTQSAPANQSNANNNNMDLLFNLNNNGNIANGGEANKENGQPQKAPDVNNTNSNAGNKNQDIFAFFQ